MDVTNLTNSIADLWEDISIPIIFHLIFLWALGFVFPNLSFIKTIKIIIESDRMKALYDLLKQTDLEKKLHFVLLFLVLIYFTVFNKVADFVGSINVFPLTYEWSNEEFLYNSNPEDLFTIASYGKEPKFDIYKINLIKDKFLDLYKAKYQERYDAWTLDVDKGFASYSWYCCLSFIFIFAFTICFIVIVKREGVGLKSTLRYLLIVFIGCVITVVFRYSAEQKLEEKFQNEVAFVNTSLLVDFDQKLLLSPKQIHELRKSTFVALKNDTNYDESFYWISKELKFILFREYETK